MTDEIIRQRKKIIQNVIDRILEYGEKYINDLEALNKKFPSKHQNNNKTIKEK